jgi:hypothetical protein
MQRWIVVGLVLAGVALSGALGGRMMRHGSGSRPHGAAAALPCVAEAPLEVASEANPILSSRLDATCAALAPGGD